VWFLPRLLKTLSLLLGSIWFIFGVYTASTPRISSELFALNFSYIAAWIIVYGLPSIFFVWLALRKTRSEKSLIDQEKPSQFTNNTTSSVYPNMSRELSPEEAQLQEVQEQEMDLEDQEKNTHMMVKHEKRVDAFKIDKVEIESVYTIPDKQISKPSQENSWIEFDDDLMKTDVFTCRICGDEINEEEYRDYKGMCRVCWLREKRRSGLFGADRASTW